jgi:hypothetical protein
MVFHRERKSCGTHFMEDTPHIPDTETHERRETPPYMVEIMRSLKEDNEKVIKS